jgi:hypothetical protein
MNKTNFVQTGGFPLNTERLEELEKAYSIFNAYGALAGDLTIISGCVTTGSNVSDGYVYISGELFPFREAAVTPTSTVIIVEQKINRPFESSEIKTVHTLRYATFGTAETSWPWSDFKLLDPITELMRRLNVLEKKNAVFQAGGGMVLWNKPAVDIPAGWQEVIDWRGRMPVGFDNVQTEFNVMGKTGGQKNKKLSIDEMPRHRHGTGSFSGVGTGVISEPWEGYNGAGDYTDYQGNDQAFSILNPYRVVYFIEYIG